MYTLDRSLIAGLPPFSGLSRTDLDVILEKARPLRVAAGQAVFEQDAEAHSFFLLLDGHVRVVKTTADGQQVIMRYISAGQLIGIATALGRTTYPATAIAAVDSLARLAERSLARACPPLSGLCRQYLQDGQHPHGRGA